MHPISHFKLARQSVSLPQCSDVGLVEFHGLFRLIRHVFKLREDFVGDIFKNLVHPSLFHIPDLMQVCYLRSRSVWCWAPQAWVDRACLSQL